MVTADGCSNQALAATKTCTVTLVLKPNAAGPMSASLTASAPGSVPANLPIKGLATGAAALTLAPPTLDFGGVVVNTVSGTKTFTITNTGQNTTGPLEVVKADSTSSVGGGSQFTYTTTCQAALAPNATCAVVVTYTPLQAAAASATITVRAVDLSTTSQAGTLLGLGLATADLVLDCDATAGAGPAVFADTVVGKTSSPITCTLTNTANTASGAITSTVGGDFAIATDNCKTANLQNNTSCTLTVTFKPTVKGPRTGVISVSSANSGVTNQQASGVGLGVVEVVALIGTECDPTALTQLAGADCKVAVQPYDFGQVSVGTTSLTTTAVTLQVWVRASVGNVVVAQAYGTPANFVTRAASPASTCPGLTTATSTAVSSTAPLCFDVVDFAPSAKGLLQGSVTATGADGTTDSGKFQGTGTGPLTISPSPLNFDAVPVGSAGAAMTLTVCNNAPTNATGASVAKDGANAADFVIVSDPVSAATIAPLGTPTPAHIAANCKMLQLRLDIPATATAGARAATVTVSATIAGVVETATVNLVGSAAGGPVLAATLGGAFPDTAITAINAPVTVTVKNTGALPTSAISYAIPAGAEFSLTPPAGQSQGTCAPVLTATPPAGVAQPAGGSCTLFVWFKPDVTHIGLGVGNRDSTLRVSSVQGGTVTLNLTAKALAQLSIAPSTTQDFGSVGQLDSTSAIKSFTITNSGALVPAAALTSAIGFFDLGTQNGANDFLLKNNTCTSDLGGIGSITPAPTCTFGVQMYPAGTSVGARTTTLQVTATGTTTLSVSLSGTAVAAPSLHFTSTTAIDRDFGLVQKGDQSTPAVYTITNTGGAPSGLINKGLFNTSNPASCAAANVSTTAHTGDFSLTSTCPTDSGLAAGASCNITITFLPNACTGGSCTPTPATLSTCLVVAAANGNGSPITGVTITGGNVPLIKGATEERGNVWVVEQASQTEPYDFGQATTNKTATFVIKNAGAAVTLATDPAARFVFAATGLSGSIAAGAGESFAAASTGTGTQCTGALAVGTLANPTSCTITVTWTLPASPTAGKRAQTLSIVNGAAAAVATATVYGTVPTAAALTASPNPLAFGKPSVGQDSTALTVTITNTGESASGALTLARSAAADSGQLTATSPATNGCDGATLAAGGTCIFTVTVNPQAAGAPASVPGIVVSDGTATTTVTATWSATNPAKVTPSVVSLDFLKVPTLKTSSPVSTITLTNPANGQPTGPLSIALAASDVDFAIASSGSCNTPTYAVNGLVPTVGVGATAATCTIDLTFTPTSLATPAKTGTLTITSTSGATATVALKGTAISPLTVTGTTASLAEDPLVSGGGTVTPATATAAAVCAYGAQSVNPNPLGFKSETFTITNAVGAAITGNLVTGLSGTNAVDFKIVNDTCIGSSISATASTNTCTVTVRFAPATAGAAKAATLTVSGVPGDSVTVSLTGTGNP